MRLSKLCGRLSDLADSGSSALCKVASTFRLAVLNRPARVVSFDKRNLENVDVVEFAGSKPVLDAGIGLRVRSVNRPSASLRYFAKRFMACSFRCYCSKGHHRGPGKGEHLCTPLLWNRFLYLLAVSDTKSFEAIE